MNVQQMKNGSLFLVPAMAAMLVVQACGGGGDAHAQDSADPHEGVWDAQMTQRHCTTGAVIGNFRGSQVIHRGGTLSDTNAAAPASRGPGFGTWTRTAPGQYSIKFRFYRFNADGSLAGFNVVTSTRTLSADGNGYEGETRGEVRDPAGTVLSTLCVSDVGTRFR